MTVSVELATVLMFGSMVVGLALGLPLAFVMGSISIVLGFFLWGPQVYHVVGFQIYGWAQQETLLAVPFFIFMGFLLERSGVAEALYEMMYRWLGRLKGGLAVGTVLICTIFAAMTGISGAACTTMGIIALPSMLKRNYSKSIAVGCISAGATLGILIPPSVMMVIYGLIAQVSVGKLFVAGVLPGLVISLIFCLYIIIRSYLQPQLCPSSEVSYTWRDKFNSIPALILPGMVILSVVGSIFLGVATPTEAAGLGGLASLICVLVNRRFTWRLLRDVTLSTLRITSMILWVIFGSVCFVTVYTAIVPPEFFKALVMGLGANRWVILSIMLFILFILGCFLDPGGIIILTAPIFVPICKSFGFDAVWLGILYIINMQMAYITPPFGYDLFYMKGICPPEISTEDIWRSIIPFVGLLILGTIIIMLFPEIALWATTKMVR